jgi:hypothetical protein
MKAKYRKSGYRCDEVEELTNLSWTYIDGDIGEELAANRTALLSVFQPAEKAYILDPSKQRNGELFVAIRSSTSI